MNNHIFPNKNQNIQYTTVVYKTVTTYSNGAEIPKCKVVECPENHYKHYCRICNNPDSNHFSRHCPFSNQNQIASNQNQMFFNQNRMFSNQNYMLSNQSNNFPQQNSFQNRSPPQKSYQKNNFSCKVPGCSEQHSAHYCKNCKNANSDHFSSACPGLYPDDSEFDESSNWDKFLSFIGFKTSKKIPFPFEKKEWIEISRILKVFASDIMNSQPFIEEEIIKIYRLASDGREKLSNLNNLVEATQHNRSQHWLFYKKLFPEIACLALHEETQKQLKEMKLETLIEKKSNTLTFTRFQIACLLSYLFFGLIPNRSSNKDLHGTVNFSELFSGKNFTKSEKLLCILNYFRRVQEWRKKFPEKLEEKVIFKRKYVSSPKGLKEWLKSKKKLNKFELDFKKAIEEVRIPQSIEVDFANRMIGGGAIRSGALQEEIRFMVSPECIPLILFTEGLHDNEVLYIIGTENINKYLGYNKTFEFDGDFQNSEHKTVIVAMDAIPFRFPEEQFSKSNIERELTKACIGFDYDDNSFNTVVTGKWGCGAFKGDPLLKFIIQWIAASELEKKMYFCCFDDHYFLHLKNLLEFFVGWEIGKMMQILVDFAELKPKISFEKHLEQALENK